MISYLNFQKTYLAKNKLLCDLVTILFNERITKAKNIFYKNIVIGIFSIIIGILILILYPINILIPAIAFCVTFGMVYILKTIRPLQMLDQFGKKGYVTDDDISRFRELKRRF